MGTGPSLGYDERGNGACLGQRYGCVPMTSNSAQEFMEDLLRSHQDEIVRGLYHGILALDDAAFKAVVREAASACRARFLRVVDLPPDLDLDGMIERISRAGPERIEITRTGDEILWRELREGQCTCPLVRRGVVELAPKMCACAAEWARGLVEMFHGGPVKVEMLESVATGSNSCLFRLKLGPGSRHGA